VLVDITRYLCRRVGGVPQSSLICSTNTKRFVQATAQTFFFINIGMRELIEILKEAREELVTPTLTYKNTDLAPVMSKESMDYHFGKLAKGYAKRYNAGEGDDRFNKNGHTLHALFFPQFKKPQGANSPKGQIEAFIKSKFGSYDDLKQEMKEEAMKIQGSGWIFLNNSGNIETIKNHDITGNPKRIIILIDWWEHVWALDYQADKGKYFDNIWRLFDWNVISQRLY
jgi:Fe-Mn family superoxide dismutase